MRAIHSILSSFKKGDIPHEIASVCFPHHGSPSSSWPLINRVLQFKSKTLDARSRKNWARINRTVRKDACPLYIFNKNQITLDFLQNPKHNWLIKLKELPVYKYEDTIDDPISTVTIPNGTKPRWKFPAGISTSLTIKHEEGALIGLEETLFLQQLTNTVSEIVAAQDYMNHKLNNIDRPIKEIAANLSFHALLSLSIINGSPFVEDNYRNVEEFSNELLVPQEKLVLLVMVETERILNLIIKSSAKYSRG